MPSEFIYIDTSAFYALLDRADRHHDNAKTLWPSLLENPFQLVTSNYMVSETVALLQSRLGFAAASLWYKDILAVVEIDWIDEATHRHGYELWVSLGRRRHSLLDCTSYMLMHKRHIEKAFSFKMNYREQGFLILPQIIPTCKTRHTADQGDRM